LSRVTNIYLIEFSLYPHSKRNLNMHSIHKQNSNIIRNKDSHEILPELVCH